MLTVHNFVARKPWVVKGKWIGTPKCRFIRYVFAKVDIPQRR